MYCYSIGKERGKILGKESWGKGTVYIESNRYQFPGIVMFIILAMLYLQPCISWIEDIHYH